jgi:hypothetical protein
LKIAMVAAGIGAFAPFVTFPTILARGFQRVSICVTAELSQEEPEHSGVWAVAPVMLNVAVNAPAATLEMRRPMRCNLTAEEWSDVLVASAPSGHRMYLMQIRPCDLLNNRKTCLLVISERLWTAKLQWSQKRI